MSQKHKDALAYYCLIMAMGGIVFLIVWIRSLTF